MIDIAKRVRDIFGDAQRPLQTRTKLVSRLQKVAESGRSGELNFFDVFTHCVKHSLVIFTREPAVERTIDFIVAFATAGWKTDTTDRKQNDQKFSDDEEDEMMSPFLADFFHFLLDFHDSHAKAVRFRVCQIISKLFDGLNDESSIDEDLAARIYDCMLVRLTDKFPAIRAQAVKAIYRLQDIDDPECPVIASFLHLMEKDSSPDVRRSALTSIAVTHRTLRAIINRTRDVKDAVRKAAYEVLAEKVKIKSLTIAQRLKLLESGVHDRSMLVKKACTERLLSAWLKDLDNRVPELLKCLHVETSPESSVFTLKALFENQPNEILVKHIEALKSPLQMPSDCSSVLIHHSELGAELALYWRVLAQYIKSLKVNDELMDAVLPLASEFCDYVQSFADNHTLFDKSGSSDETIQQSEFVMQQLLLLCGCFDYSDEIGRKRVQALTRRLFLDDNTPFTLVESLVALFNETERNEEKFVQTLVEFISEIKEPMIVEELPRNPEETRRKEIELAKLKIELNELREELDISVKGGDFSKAAVVKEKISKLEEKSEEIQTANQQPQNQTIRIEKNDPFTVLKCLSIASEMLARVQKRALSPTIQSLADTLIWPSVQNADLLIRNAAIKCIGLIGLLSKEFATENFVLFLQAAQIDLELVQITATQVIFDLILLYGFEAFEVKHAMEADSKSTNDSSLKSAEEDEENDEEINSAVSGTRKEEDQADLVHLNLGSNEASASASDIVLSALVVLLDGESEDLRFVVAEGMCKLLLSGRIRSAKLYTRLVLLWYNPARADDFKLRQCLGVFLPNFALVSRLNQELVEESFLPVMRTLFNAPETSPLAEVDPISVVELMVQLTCLRHRQDHLNSNKDRSAIEKDSNMHDTMAIRVANEILSNSDFIGIRCLCKVLPMLEISIDNDMLVRDLSVLCSKILEEIDDRVSIKLIQKFQSSLGYKDIPEGPDLQASGQNAVAMESTESYENGAPKNITLKNEDVELTHQRSTIDRASKREPRKVQNSIEDSQDEESDDSEMSSEETNFKQQRRTLSSRASKSAALEKTKLNLESVLSVSDSDDTSSDVTPKDDTSENSN